MKLHSILTVFHESMAFFEVFVGILREYFFATVNQGDPGVCLKELTARNGLPCSLGT